MSQRFFQKVIFAILFSLVFCCVQAAQATTVSVQSIVPGDYVQIENSPAIYLITPNYERQYFLSSWIFKCYQSDYSKVKVLPKNTDLDLYFPSASQGLVLPDPSCGLVKSSSSHSVYAFDKQGMRHKIKDEASARALYGSNWAQKVHDMPVFIFSLFPIGTEFDETHSNTTENSTSQVPKIFNPKPNELLTNYPRKASLSWSRVSNAKKYEIQLACDFCGSTQTKWLYPATYYSVQAYYETPALAGDNQFRFRVRAIFADNSVGDWSDYSYFRYNTSNANVDNSSDTPQIIFPSQNHVYTDFPRRPLIQWTGVSGVDHYEVFVVCADCQYVTLNTLKYSSKNTFYIPTEDESVKGDGNHKVRVRGVYKDGTYTPWSDYVFFSYDTSDVVLTLNVSAPATEIYTDETLRIKAQPEGNSGMEKIEIYVNDVLSHTCYNTSICEYTAGPFGAFYNGQINYYARAYRGTTTNPILYSEIKYVSVKDRFVVPTLDTFTTDANISVTDDPTVTLTSQTNNGTSLDKIELYVNGVRQYTCFNVPTCSDTVNTLAYMNQGFVNYYSIGYIDTTHRIIYSPVHSINIQSRN